MPLTVDAFCYARSSASAGLESQTVPEGQPLAPPGARLGSEKRPKAKPTGWVGERAPGGAGKRICLALPLPPPVPVAAALPLLLPLLFAVLLPFPLQGGLVGGLGGRQLLPGALDLLFGGRELIPRRRQVRRRRYSAGFVSGQRRCRISFCSDSVITPHSWRWIESCCRVSAGGPSHQKSASRIRLTPKVTVT